MKPLRQLMGIPDSPLTVCPNTSTPVTLETLAADKLVSGLSCSHVTGQVAASHRQGYRVSTGTESVTIPDPCKKKKKKKRVKEASRTENLSKNT